MADSQAVSVPLGAEIEQALEDASRAAFWLTAFSYAFLDNSGRSDAPAALEQFRSAALAWRDSLQRQGPTGSGFPTFAQADDNYHRAVEQAFALAVGAAPGEDAGPADVADAARATLLEDVLLPYNRLIGQSKHNDSMQGLYPAANTHFRQWLADSSGLDADARERALGVFARLLDLAETNRKRILEHWHGDSRQVWLPLQLGLRPEQHDSQEELNGLIALALGRPFTSGNVVLPINNSWFHRDLITSLHAAEDYHVLWVHDYVGVNTVGEPDTIGFEVSIDGYLDALTQAVRRYDETGKLPTFLIFLDQNGYATNDGRLWMTLLEDPLDGEIELPGQHPEMRAAVQDAQRELRAAVAGSRRLRSEAAVRGEDWLRNVVKVHVNITFPADFSFRSSQLVSWFPDWFQYLPDELMRDHRKIAFYDITERDPRRGLAMFTGTGVGEQYASPTWEDRGVLAIGPALVALKDAARTLLIRQGFPEDQIPPSLRPLPRPADYDSLVAWMQDAGADARALNVHNQVGFAPKRATLVQAMLYTLMPSGCVIYVPDSLWLSGFWAGQLVGAAFRGCDVRIIAPALPNAPVQSKPVMARSRALVARLLEIQNLMQDVFAAAGGSFRVGLYTRTADMNDLPAMLREAQVQFGNNPFLREEFPLPEPVYDLLAAAPDLLTQGGFETQPLVRDAVERAPQLHRKTQLLAMRPVMRAVAGEMDVATIREYLINVAAGIARPDSVPSDLASRAAVAYPMVSRIEQLPGSLRDSTVFFTLVGSMNKDARGMLLDGETLHVVAGPWSMMHYPDFALLLGRTTWLREPEQLDELLPPYSTLNRWLGRLLRDVF